MDRIRLIVLIAMVALIGILAVSSYVVTERDDATIKAAGIRPAK